MSADVARVLRRAAANLEERGWCQGELCTADGRVCMLGAICTTKAGHEREGDAVVALHTHLGVVAIAPWNDTPGRTQQDVVKAMLETADVEDFR